MIWNLECSHLNREILQLGKFLASLPYSESLDNIYSKLWKLIPALLLAKPKGCAS